jgi:Protein of unknown function (DUF2711)
MTTRILPPPDVFASCPLDGKILEFYAGTFDAVYISLNPFIKAVTLDKAIFQPGTYPAYESIVANCRPVLWSEVAKLAELPSLAAVDIGLRTGIGGLRKELQNNSYAKALEALFDIHSILSPSEGTFSDLLYDRILQSIQGLGYEWLWVGDEFCTERKLHWIDELRQRGDSLTRGRYNVFTPDKQLLWTIHWDSHFSFLCSSAEKLVTISHASELEGFLCTPSTEVYWSLYPEGGDTQD